MFFLYWTHSWWSNFVDAINTRKIEWSENIERYTLHTYITVPMNESEDMNAMVGFY